MTAFAAARVVLPVAAKTPLAGFVGSSRVTKNDSASLEANIISFASSGRKVTLISLDALYAGLIYERLNSDLASQPGLDLIVCASHTHFAPNTEPILPALGELDDGFVDLSVQRIKAALSNLVYDTDVATMNFGRAPIRRIVSRRGRGFKVYRTARFRLRVTKEVGWRPQRVPEGLRQLRFIDLHSLKQRAVIVSLPCHPTMAPSQDSISADFIGPMRDHIRHLFDDLEMPILFLQGFSGDLRPQITSLILGQSAGEILENLLNLKAGFRRTSRRAWSRWINSLLSALDVAISDSQLREASNLRDVDYRSAQTNLANFLRGAPTEINFDLALLDLGLSAKILFATGELSSEFVAIVERVCTSAEIVPVAYSNRTVGYLPTDHERELGGYEAGGFYRRVNLDWEPTDCENQFEKILKIAYFDR